MALKRVRQNSKKARLAKLTNFFLTVYYVTITLWNIFGKLAEINTAYKWKKYVNFYMQLPKNIFRSILIHVILHFIFYKFI